MALTALDRTRIVNVDAMEWKLNIAPFRGGCVDSKMIAEGEAVPGIMFDFGLYRYHPGDDAFVTPRHHHENDQIRFSLEGDHNFGPRKDLPEGWVGYFSPGTWYGPQRTDRGLNLRAQFGVDPSRFGRAGREGAYEELSKKGGFRNGVFTYADPETGKKVNREPTEAMHELRTGKKLEYPVARYEEPILINPAAFEWRRLVDGVWHKHLGTFTEREERIAMVRFEQGGVLALTPERLQLLFTLKGRCQVDGEWHGPRTAISCPYEEVLEVTGAEGAELLFIGGPQP